MAIRSTHLLLVLGMSALVGAAGGVGAYTFGYARGASYLGNDPETCANCHVMQGHLDAWQKSSHHAVATCNDCHTPHDFAGKYATKARNGLMHSIAFTSGSFPEPLRIKPHNREIAERSCRGCHATLIEAIDHAPGLSCTSCHRNVGHDR